MRIAVSGISTSCRCCSNARETAAGRQASWQTGTEPDALIDRVLSISPGVSKEDWPVAYEKILAPLPPGVYQLIVHLGYDDEEMRGATSDHPDWGAAWRQYDLDLVRSDRSGNSSRDQRFVLAGWKDLSDYFCWISMT